MGDVLKSNGLVLYLMDNAGNFNPFACAKNSTIAINKEVIELAPKTGSIYRQYIKGRQSFTVTGSGLIKITQAGFNTIDFFDYFIKGIDNTYSGRFSMVDPQGFSKNYAFACIITDLTLESTIGATPSYSFTLQGVNGFIEY